MKDVRTVNQSKADRGPDEDPYQVFVKLFCRSGFVWTEEEMVEIGRRTGTRLGREDFGRVVAVMRKMLTDEGLIEESL